MTPARRLTLVLAAGLLVVSLAMWEKTVGPVHQEVARTVRNLARLNQAQGRHTEAESFLRRARAVYESPAARQWDQSLYVAILDELATVYVSLGKLAEAQEARARAAAVRAIR